MKLRTCTGSRCWICELNKGKASPEIHAHIAKDIQKKARYYLGFQALCVFLVGEEEVDRLYNGYAEEWAGDPQHFALKVLSSLGLRRSRENS